MPVCTDAYILRSDSCFPNVGSSISVSRKLTDLSLLCPPFKTEYYEGERLNRSGLKLLAKFSDGTSFSPSNVAIELVEQGCLTLGMTSVHFRYLDKTVVVGISVCPLQLEVLSIDFAS